MTQTLDPTPQTVVHEAVQGGRQTGQQRPDGKTVTAALLALERTTKRNQQVMPIASLLGTWRLVFSAGKQAKFQSGKPTGNGFYVPRLAIARIAFSRTAERESSLAIANELNVGPLTVRFTGPARYPGKQNLLVFDFTQLQVRCFGLTVYQGQVGGKKRAGRTFEETAIAKLPFFAFFAATDDYIAARGRGGGLAIWMQEQGK